MKTQNFLLTDVENGISTDDFELTPSQDLQLQGADDWKISKQTMRGGLSEGIDVVEIDNGQFSLSILPTRGMGLWKGQFQKLELGWNSPVKLPVNPAYVNLTERSGLGWLTGFNELLCRCGLASNGAPGTDIVQDNNGNPIQTELTLHGKIANTPAHFVEAEVSDEGQGKLRITGIVDETMLFGPCLRLTSTLETIAGSNRVTIIDQVTNLSAKTAEMQLLYHTNLGAPFLEQGSQFVTAARQIAPRDPLAAKNMAKFDLYREPTTGYIEECYFFEPSADSAGRTSALLKNSAGDKGFSLTFDRTSLPCLTLWKNTQAEKDGYVTGIEPATNYPNLKTFEREQGRVIRLESGETYETRLELAVHISNEEVAEIEQKIAAQLGDLKPTIHNQPCSTFSPS